MFRLAHSCVRYRTSGLIMYGTTRLSCEMYTGNAASALRRILSSRKLQRAAIERLKHSLVRGIVDSALSVNILHSSTAVTEPTPAPSNCEPHPDEVTKRELAGAMPCQMRWIFHSS
jgi:hypothetical protein